ncbi:MAG TPA: hypothetical protein VIK97_07345 [Casimicrobiaceae bacterium]
MCVVAVAALWLAHIDGKFVSIPGWLEGEQPQMWSLFCGTLIAGIGIVLARPRTAHRVLAVGLLGWSVVAFGPAGVAAVAFLATTACFIGLALLRLLRMDSADLLAGVSIGATAIAAVLAATAAMRIHWPATYALAAGLTIGLLRGEWSRVRSGLLAWWAARPRDCSRTDLLALALLVALAAVHVAVAARPEVGHDALSVHLQIATDMVRDHRFRFDVGAHVWAVMPLGADLLYAAAFQVGGEAAAKATNLAAFGLLVAWIARLARGNERVPCAIATALAAVFASMPLAFAETSTLYIENYWAAMLIGATALAERAVREHDADWGLACLWLAAGALQAKVIGVLWVIPLALALAWALRARLRTFDRRQFAALVAVLAVAAWPYLNAAMRTGNPVFPFMNALFRSPWFDTTQSFNNTRFNAPLTWHTWYDLVVDSGRFLEGAGGAPGLQWLFLFPACLVLLRRAQWPSVLPLLALAGVFFVATWTQQSYLRYLYPALALLTVVAARILAPTVLNRGIIAFAAAVPLVAVNLQLMPSGGWWNSSFCLACSYNPDARARYADHYAEQRRLVAWLNANAPDARVGWLRLDFAGPAGLTGPVWLVSWHDWQAWKEVVDFTTADEFAAYARKRGTDFFILPRFDGPTPFERAIVEFRDRYTTPIRVSGGSVLARWADLPDRRRLSLPKDFDPASHNAGVVREPERITFAPRGLYWSEFPLDSRAVTYQITPACSPGAGRGVVNLVWLDDHGETLRDDTQYYACSDNHQIIESSEVAPPHAERVRVFVGSAVDAPFALSMFTLSAR